MLKFDVFACDNSQHTPVTTVLLNPGESLTIGRGAGTEVGAHRVEITQPTIANTGLDSLPYEAMRIDTLAGPNGARAFARFTTSVPSTWVLKSSTGWVPQNAWLELHDLDDLTLFRIPRDAGRRPLAAINVRVFGELASRPEVEPTTTRDGFDAALEAACNELRAFLYGGGRFAPRLWEPLGFALVLHLVAGTTTNNLTTLFPNAYQIVRGDRKGWDTYRQLPALKSAVEKQWNGAIGPVWAQTIPFASQVRVEAAASDGCRQIAEGLFRLGVITNHEVDAVRALITKDATR